MYGSLEISLKVASDSDRCFERGIPLDDDLIDDQIVAAVF